MNIVGAINSPGPVIPENLTTHIKIRTCCQLSIKELTVLKLVIDSISDYIQTHPIQKFALCIIVFTDQNQLTLQQEEHILGQSLPLTTIWMKQIRCMKNYTNVLFPLVLTEEICHTLFQEYNEYKVKEMVFDILQPHLGGIKLHSTYPTMFDENGHRIPDPDYPIEWLSD